MADRPNGKASRRAGGHRRRVAFPKSPSLFASHRSAEALFAGRHADEPKTLPDGALVTPGRR